MDINLEAICGDAIIELKKIESNSVDLIVTDQMCIRDRFLTVEI